MPLLGSFSYLLDATDVWGWAGDTTWRGGPHRGEGMWLGERAEDVSLWIGKLPI